MFWSTHLAAGLIVGKLSGRYDIALIGTFAIDLDHLVPAIKSKTLLHPRKFLKTTLAARDTYRNKRGILHNFFIWLICSLLFMLINFGWGWIFSLAYAAHLLLDALDNVNFYPFSPLSKIKARGPIPYASRREILLSILLFLMFLVI